MTNSLRIAASDHDLGARIGARLGEHTVVAVAGGVDAAREALRRGDADVAVHLLAEVPHGPVEGIELLAVVKREDARDALVSEGGVRLADLGEGARVGVDSALRRAQVLQARPDLRVVGSESAPPAPDAVVAAASELARAGRPASEVFELADWPTAPAQGAIALEVAAGAAREVHRRVAKLDHRTSRLTTAAELAVAAGLGDGVPLAATAILDDGLLFLTATAYAPDGAASITASHAAYPEDTDDPAAELGARVAAELLERGADRLGEGAA